MQRNCFPLVKNDRIPNTCAQNYVCLTYYGQYSIYNHAHAKNTMLVWDPYTRIIPLRPYIVDWFTRPVRQRHLQSVPEDIHVTRAWRSQVNPSFDCSTEPRLVSMRLTDSLHLSGSAICIPSPRVFTSKVFIIRSSEMLHWVPFLLSAFASAQTANRLVSSLSIVSENVHMKCPRGTCHMCPGVCRAGTKASCLVDI